MKILKNGRLSDFQKGQIVCACLVGAYVTKTATLLCVSRATVPKVITVHINHGKMPSADRNSGCKPIQSERDCHTLQRIVSKNNAATALKAMGELNIHLEVCVFPHKQSSKCFTNPTSTGLLQMLNF